MLRDDPAERFSSLAEIGREAEWIADRLYPGPEPLAASPSSTSWKNVGIVGVVGLALLAIAASAGTS